VRSHGLCVDRATRPLFSFAVEGSGETWLAAICVAGNCAGMN
jgi:hypothetical protein